MAVKGGGNISKNYKKATANIVKGVQQGLLVAAIRIQLRSKKLTPVDTGNLRASHYALDVSSQTGEKTARVGATAQYAV